MKRLLTVCAICVASACSCAAEAEVMPTTTTTSTTVTTTTTTTTAPPTTTTVRPTTTTQRASRGVPRTEANVAILERIAKCESGGSYTAKNKHSTASGKYQVLDSTWGNYGGFAHAKDAPPNVQEAQAHELFARRGTQPWNASRGCWK